jgi:hypothetical protein
MMTRRCRHCRAPAKGTRCARHAAEHRRREEDRREALRQAGICVKCGKRPVAQTQLASAGPRPRSVRVRKPARYCAPCLAYFAARLPLLDR